jgi:hypothetical protein
MLPILSLALFSILVLSPISAWPATQYIEVSYISLDGGGTFTSTAYLTPRATITESAMSTTYTTYPKFEQLTIQYLILTNQNLPTVSYTLDENFRTSEFTCSNFWAPATTTVPSTYSGTSFSYSQSLYAYFPFSPSQVEQEYT